MPDELMPPDGIKTQALKRGVLRVFRAIQRAAPTERSASTFTIERYKNGFQVVSRDMGTTMTELNKRHPTFGNDPWTNQNVHHPGRTHFMEKATSKAISAAVEDMADDYVRLLVDDTAWERA